LTISVRIAIPTFRRPAGIRRALEGVVPQVAALNDGGEVVASVVVIDNDPDASAREIVEGFGVAYEHEPAPGIASVRNRSLDACSDQTAIILMDDDEVPEPGWLETLVGVYRSTGADGVAGRVVTTFPDEVPEWVLVSGAFRRPQRRDLQVIDEAASNNLLLDMDAVRRSGLRFDPDFGLTGGSDSLFTRQFVEWGAHLRWSDHAVMIEQEDEERFTRGWVRMRSFRTGNTVVRVRLALAGSPRDRMAVRARYACEGAGRVAFFGAKAVLGVLTRSLRLRASGERSLSKGAGMVAGALGHAHDEYGNRRRRLGL
jgi:glycosyltransferase involved in cell wall biosynthesis